MTSATVRPLNPLLWLGAPTLISVVASLVFALPFEVFGLRLPEPVFALVPAFSWPMIRPSVAPPLFLVIAGVLLDLLWGGAIGLWPLCLLTAYALTFFGRRALANLGFWSLWGGYAATCAGALLVGWLILSIRSGVWPNLVSVAWQFLATAALFPFAFGLIERYEDADVRFR